MQKLSNLEKREVLAGGARWDSLKAKVMPIYEEKIKSQFTKKQFPRFLHNSSFLALSGIAGILNLIDGIWELNADSGKLANRYSSNYKGYKGRPYGYYSNNYADSRRDYFAYASEALRPSIRFTPYPSKTTFSFGLPWAH